MRKIHLHGAGRGPAHHGGGDPGDPDQAGGRADHQDSKWPGRLELMITVALGLAATLGAFAAYRNEQRNHQATAQFSIGVRNFEDAGQLYATGNAAFTRDQSLFLEYAKAIQQKDKQLANYIFTNLMGPVLQAGVKWWEGPNARSAQPARTPFTPRDPDYGIPQITAAMNSTNASKENFSDAHRAQDKADHFTLLEVILATALFLYGIAGVTRNMTLKIGMLMMGGLIFVISGVLLLIG